MPKFRFYPGFVFGPPTDRKFRLVFGLHIRNEKGATYKGKALTLDFGPLPNTTNCRSLDNPTPSS